MSKNPVYYDVFESPLGALHLTFAGAALIGVSFAKPSGVSYKEKCAPEKCIEELASYFEGGNRGFTQEIHFLKGTEFERQVWHTLMEIPFGETRPYKWVAEKIGRPGAVRAVGQALSKNPIPIVVPCHRVIESDGSIGGYSSGVHTKVRLLEIEYYTKMNKNAP